MDKQTEEKPQTKEKPKYEVIVHFFLGALGVILIYIIGQILLVVLNVEGFSRIKPLGFFLL